MGGGVMRAAAKVAGVTVSSGGIPIFSATRRVASSRSTAAAVAAVDDVKMAASQTPSEVKTNSSEIEDWVFAGGDESILSHGDVTTPRAVFGEPPTLQEAKDATSELAVALNKMYLPSPDSIEYEYDSLVTNETAVPAHALQAFRFLHESHVAQDVVASIASDPNVWEAVLRNQELQEFVQSQRASYASSNKSQTSAESSEVGSEHSESQHDIGLMNVVHRVRFTVVDMMSNLSVYFQNFFGGDKGVDRIFPATNSGGNSSAEAVMETSFVGLAVMAIVVIIVKRE